MAPTESVWGMLSEQDEKGKRLCQNASGPGVRTPWWGVVVLISYIHPTAHPTFLHFLAYPS